METFKNNPSGSFHFWLSFPCNLVTSVSGDSPGKTSHFPILSHSPRQQQETGGQCPPKWDSIALTVRGDFQKPPLAQKRVYPSNLQGPDSQHALQPCRLFSGIHIFPAATRSSPVLFESSVCGAIGTRIYKYIKTILLFLKVISLLI